MRRSNWLVCCVLVIALLPSCRAVNCEDGKRRLDEKSTPPLEIKTDVLFALDVTWNVWHSTSGYAGFEPTTRTWVNTFPLSIWTGVHGWDGGYQDGVQSPPPIYVPIAATSQTHRSSVYSAFLSIPALGSPGTGFEDMQSAMEQIKVRILQASNPHRIVVIVSDGRVVSMGSLFLPSEQQQASSILAIADELALAGVRVYCFGLPTPKHTFRFEQDRDFDLLQEIARRTGGRYQRLQQGTPSPFGLPLKSFYDAIWCDVLVEALHQEGRHWVWFWQ